MATDRDPVLRELVNVRKLMTLMLLKSGCTSDEIAKALRIDSSTIRHEMPTRVKRFPFAKD